MTVKVDGILSGIDTTSLINAMLSASGVPKQAIQARISSYEVKSERISDLVSRIEDLKTSLEDMEAIGDFRSFSASYEDSGAFAVEVNGEAVEGSYEIDISQMARAEQWVGLGFSDKSTDAGMSGNLAFDYNGTTTTIDTTGLSLTEIASEINDVDGVTAYVMNTGDATNPYRLVIQGDDRGADYSFDFSASDGGVAASLGVDDTANRKVEASSALLTINGVDVTANSNTVTDAVPGMTITITGETDGPVTVDVSSDPDAIEDKVQAFVDAYNEVVNFISTNSMYDYDKGIRGAFVGESGVRRVSQGMAFRVTSAYTGLSQDYNALSLIGISTDSDGKLSIDSEKFQEVLLAEPDQVADLFTSDAGFITAMKEQLDVYTDSSEGTLSVRKDTIEERISSMNDDVDAMQDRLDRLEARLRKQFTSMESVMGQMQGSQAYIATMLTSLTTTSG